MSDEQTLDRLRAYLDNPHPTVEEAHDVFMPLTVGDYDDVTSPRFWRPFAPAEKQQPTLRALRRHFSKPPVLFPSLDTVCWIQRGPAAMERIPSTFPPGRR